MNNTNRKIKEFNRIYIEKLYLTNNHDLPLSFIKLMNQNEELIRIKYNKFIDELLKLNKQYIFSFLQRSTIRNTYKSKLFTYFCFIDTITFILQNGSIKEIYTDNRQLNKCLLQLPSVKNNLCKIVFLKKRRYLFLKIIKNILVSFYLVFINFFISRLFFKKQKNLKDVILIDTFITSNNFNKNNVFTEIFYKNLIKQSKNFKKKIYFFPTFYKLNSPFKIYKVYKSLKASDYQFIIMGLYFNLFSTFKAFFYSLVTPFNVKIIPKWNNIDVSSIINHEKFLDMGEYSFLQSVMIFKSIEKIKKNNINFRLVIDWFENQNLDRALNISINKFYPNIITKGYLGFVPEDYYAGLFPSKGEYNLKMIPKKIITIGEVFEKKINKYCDNVKVSNGPAFRFQELYKDMNRAKIKKNNILLCLPMHINDSKDIIELANKSVLDEKYKFIIKPHPQLSQKLIENKISISKDTKFIFSNKPLYELFNESDIIITTASSTCLEAILFGLKVIIAGSKVELTKNNLDGIIDNNYWKVCYEAKELEEFVNQKNITKNYKIEDFFTQVNNYSVSKFLEN